MSLTDYSKIKEIIDDIVGVNTKQGNNLKRAIKNYFDSKPVNAVSYTHLTLPTICSV